MDIWTNIILALGFFFIAGYLDEINKTLKKHLEETLKHRLHEKRDQ